MKLQHRTHSRPRHLVWLLAALLLALCAPMVGCLDEGEGDGGGSETGHHEMLLVTPEFHVEGLDDLRHDVLLRDLYLGVGEIRLEPLDEGYEGLVYVTRTPMVLHFDLDHDGVTIKGEPVTLPHAGEYLISIGLEPLGVTSGDEASQVLSGKSMRIDGMMARYSTPTSEDKTAAGEPVPLPWRVLGEEDEASPAEAPVNWVPWTYSSSQASFVTLNDVHFTEDVEQTLIIAFDLSAWLDGVLAPLDEVVDARGQEVKPNPRAQADFDANAIDVSDALNSMNKDGLDDLAGRGEAYVR